MNNKPHPKVELDQIIDAYGGSRKMGQSLDCISRQAIEGWTEVPVKWVLRIEKDTGFTRYQIRPDIYGSRPVDIEPREVTNNQ